MKKNRRMKSFALLILAAVLLAVIAAFGGFWQEAAIATDFTEKKSGTVYTASFGTDWMGRDMFMRDGCGTFFKYPDRISDGCGQRSDGARAGTQRGGLWEICGRCGRCSLISSWEFPICCF